MEVKYIIRYCPELVTHDINDIEIKQVFLQKTIPVHKNALDLVFN
jgi:hypothetical protein